MSTTKEVILNTSLQSNLMAIKSSLPKAVLEENPKLLDEIRNNDRESVNDAIKVYSAWRDELLPYIKALSDNINDITEQTELNAVYLLLCYAIQNLNAFFLLAKEGNYSMAFAVYRIIKESSTLAQTFIILKRKRKTKNLNNWYRGKIIGHSTSREAFQEFAKEDGLYPDLDLQTLQSDLYAMESQAIHSGYAMMLENISPFTERFDLNDNTGYRRLVGLMKYAKGVINNINRSLQMVYKFLLDSKAEYSTLDTILLRYDPTMKEQTLDESVLHKYRKNA